MGVSWSENRAMWAFRRSSVVSLGFLGGKVGGAGGGCAIGVTGCGLREMFEVCADEVRKGKSECGDC